MSHLYEFRVKSLAFALALPMLASVSAFAASFEEKSGPAKVPTHKTIPLQVTTQAPVWPPSEMMDENGNFVVVGMLLDRDASGNVLPRPGAAIVSKDTVPPLNADGVEDFSNIFGSSHSIVRELDISQGSPDLRLKLYTSSFGPSVGNFGGGPRIPAAGKSKYNLNALPVTCAEVFPSESQKTTYIRDSFPLHRAPVLGFQGDQVAYDVNSGEKYDPMSGSGQGCGSGCSGENMVDEFPIKKPVTLGKWLSAKAKVDIDLKDWDSRRRAYKSARFTLTVKDAMPNGLYTAWLVRANVAANQGKAEYRNPDPSNLPNVIVTDSHGDGKLEFELNNPFPNSKADEKGLRVVGMAVDYHNDYQNWGACFSRFGAGVDIHAHWTSMADGTPDFTNFVTVSDQ